MYNPWIPEVLILEVQGDVVPKKRDSKPSGFEGQSVGGSIEVLSESELGTVPESVPWFRMPIPGFEER